MNALAHPVPWSLTRVLLCLFLTSTTLQAQLQISDPEANAYLSGTYEVVLTTANPDQVARTELFVDGVAVFQKDGWWETIDHHFGETIVSHTLYAQTTDRAGKTQVSATVRTRRLEINLETSSEVLLLTAVVKTSKNDALTGLRKQDFSVLENGVPLEISSFYNERLPLDLVFCIDTSSSLKVKGIDTVKAATEAFLQALEPTDRVNLYEIKNEPIKVMDFTTDRKRLLNHIRQIEAVGETALFDTVILGLADLKQRIRGRKALILFTDGRDSVYEEPEDKARLMREAITLAQNQEVALFTIGLGSRIHSEAMERMALETGGRFHHAEGASDLVAVFAELVADLKHQYVLGAIPKAHTTGFQKLEVKTQKRGAIVYARSGYTRP